ncbi:hypothetical protein [Clostridium akagii]|uniref:hypothetical protein n=1 Tax=Clostridium akagii TaxID=91623 RepID=UPI00055A7EE5|nr:hypothetical protein [Clostridium akagii]
MNNIFVRISYNNANVDNLKSTKIRNGEINANKYLIAGGFYNKNGGSMVFKAKSLEEVRQITEGKPLIENANMRYDVVILPQNL